MIPDQAHHIPYGFSIMRESAKNKSAIVYCAINTINKKTYIGVTSKPLNRRISEHRCQALKKIARTKFYNAIRKHGFENFNWYVLSTWGNYSDALKEEIRVIALVDPIKNYNITKGGDGVVGYKQSPELIKRLSDQARGRPSPLRGVQKTEEYKENMRRDRRDNPEKYKVSWAGKKGDPEIGKKISIANTGRKVSDATRRNQSLAKLKNPNRYWLGKKRDAKTIEKISKTKMGTVSEKRKPVICLNDGRIFTHSKSAADFYKLNPRCIRAICLGKQKKSQGLYFKYVEE